MVNINSELYITILLTEHKKLVQKPLSNEQNQKQKNPHKQKQTTHT